MTRVTTRRLLAAATSTALMTGAMALTTPSSYAETPQPVDEPGISKPADAPNRSLRAGEITAASDDVFRISGSDRIETSIAASWSLFGPADGSDPTWAPASAAILARSDDFADGLAGVPLAAEKDAPLLLTKSTSLDPRVLAELERTLPTGSTVYLLGGTGALSSGVEAAVQAAGYHTVRFAGSDRYTTALDIAADPQGLNHRYVLLTTGRNFPDALSAGPAAGTYYGAILLTNDGTMPASVDAYLDAHPDMYVQAIGGQAHQAAVSSGLAAEDRYSAIVGSNRYDTAARVADEYFGMDSPTTEPVEGPDVAGVASGTNFPDALSGGAVMALLGQPLVLSPPAGLDDTTRYWMQRHADTLDLGLLFGGEGALSTTVEQQTLSAISGG